MESEAERDIEGEFTSERALWFSLRAEMAVEAVAPLSFKT